MKKIIIAGGTGFIGSYLTRRFLETGNEVQLVSRAPGHIPWQKDALVAALEGADVLINLAGKNINCRYTEANKELILRSRITTTTLLGEAMRNCKNPPELWINASASAIYQYAEGEQSTEKSDKFANNFLATVVHDWENVFFSFQLPNTRHVALRTSVVLGNEGGAFPPLKMLTRYGLGGKAGTGKQAFSWIHIDDYFNAIQFLMSASGISGAVNGSAPQIVSNAQLMLELRRSMKMPFGLPAPAFAVKIGAAVIGTDPGLILDGVSIFPEVLVKSGFVFKFADLKSAISQLLNKN